MSRPGGHPSGGRCLEPPPGRSAPKAGGARATVTVGNRWRGTGPRTPRAGRGPGRTGGRRDRPKRSTGGPVGRRPCRRSAANDHAL